MSRKLCVVPPALLVLLAARLAGAHPVTVDGDAADWFLRVPNAMNLGIVARNSQQQGEWVWLDAIADTRTDLATPEVVADIAAFQVTGDAAGVSFLVRRGPGNMAGAPIQVQIAIDLDLVAGSGQEFFAEFADTKVGNGARWERLVYTLFGSGGTAKVVDGSFSQVAIVPAVAGNSGSIEIGVPWSALGLNGAPATPLRLTVATFRAQNNDLTIDIGGPMLSNVLDALTHYGEPAASMYPNTFQEVQDQIVDHSVDVWFSPAGEVYAPVVVQRFVSNATAGGSDEWYVVRNVSPSTIALDGYRLGDEETPDGTEAMFTFPAGATIGAGASYVVARNGASYQAFFGVAPDAELPPGASMAVPDMTPYAAWAPAASPNLQLANTGDELLVLDPAASILDVAAYGNVTYLGITSYTPAPAADHVLTRKPTSDDTDDCQVDFSDGGVQCATDAQCGGGACTGCVLNACGPKPQGSACPDADVCNGGETCDGSGMCVAGMALSCDDGNDCTTHSCDPVQGCAQTTLADGTPCGSAQCNGQCAAGQCDCAGMGGAGGAGSGGSGGAGGGMGGSGGGAGGAGGGMGGAGGGGGGAGGMGGSGGSSTGGSGGAGNAGGMGGSSTGGSSAGGAGGTETSSSSSSTSSTGPGATGGTSNRGDAFEDDGGCGCRVAGDSRDDRALLLFAAAVAGAFARRRRVAS